MELRLERGRATGCTIGRLLVDGRYESYVLEDVIREIPGEPVSAWKVSGQTAIPTGRYRVILDFSHRFQAILPLLLCVPGFEGIRIHAGNKAADTEGCLLVGQTRYPANDSIGASRDALNALLPKLRAAVGEIWIEIVNPPAVVT